MKNFNCLLSLTLLVFLAVKVTATPPTPPAGYKWVLSEQYSDEFDGTSLDLNKWRKKHPFWNGRRPAYFNPDAISVSGGYMKITNGVYSQPFDGYDIYGGAVTSVNENTKFAYYECKLKASSTRMSTTFWLENRKASLPGGCGGDSYSQELDIVETIGQSTNPDFYNYMKSNTHFRWKNCSGGKEQFFSRGTKTGPMSPQSDEDFHVYGAWWKDATQVQFYLDNNPGQTVQFRTDKTSTPFNRGMFICMVTETYNWEQRPLNSRLTNPNLNTSYYDWVRVWTLVPCSGGDCGNPGGTNTVSCANIPATIPSQTSYTFQVPYVASTTRDVSIEFWENGAWKKNAKTSVNAGSGTASVTVNLNAAPANGANVLLKVAIRPTGTNYQQNIDACEGTMTVGGTTPTCDVPYSAPNITVTKQTVNWSSAAIDISCASSVNISMTLAGVGPMETADYLNVYYKVDGGSQIAISENTNSFASKNVSANGVSGNSLELIVKGYTSWGDETYTVSNISVVDPTKSAQESIASQDIQKSKLSLFPNPVSDELYLKLSSKLKADAQLCLYNNAGLLIQTQRLTNNNPSLELSNLSRGMYVIMLINGSEIITEKFIKQ